MIARDGEEYDGTGWKFLTPYGSTIYNGKEFYYPLPRPGEKWGEWITHPNPAYPDGLDCGPGRLHVMNRIDARYAPSDWWIWFVQYKEVIGQSGEKTAVRALRLRRVPKKAFCRMIRLGWCKEAYLAGANLMEADLMGANLMEACLEGANLVGADLRRANLSGANLEGSDVREADLSGANLPEAYLEGANLRRAYLRGANLRGANLDGADLREADLRMTDLRKANLREADLRNADLKGAKLSEASLPDNWKEITNHD